MSPLDPDIPPVGEEIHLPGPSIIPMLTAVGVTLLLVGFTTFIEFTVIGAILTVFCVARWIKDTGTTSTSFRSTDSPHRRLGRGAARAPSTRAAPYYPAAAPAGTGQIAPSSVQQRTTSRTERIPTVSPCSTTIRWRKPPRTIADAAFSKDQSGAAKTT